LVRKKSLSELDQAEIKLQTLFEKRGALNQEASVFRQERDLIHEAKREITGRIREIRVRRMEHIADARGHRDKRNELQRRGKEFIEVKRKLRGQSYRSAGEEFRQMKRQIDDLEFRQQTATLSLSDENKLLDTLKSKMRRLSELEALKIGEDRLAAEVMDLDAEITNLFAAADLEHRAAQEASEKARELDSEMDVFIPQVSALALEGDHKHEAYLEAKARADEVHAKIVAMREKVLAVRETQRAERREARELLKAQNRSVRRNLFDEKMLEESANDALRALLQKGRVEIGR